MVFTPKMSKTVHVLSRYQHWLPFPLILAAFAPKTSERGEGLGFMFKRSRAAEGGRKRVTGNAVGTGSKKREGQACSGGIAPEFKSQREVQCETPELSKCFFQLPAPLLSPGTLSACTDRTNAKSRSRLSVIGRISTIP